jgi:peptidoglycan/xylan/chitin deacetylase (PgdA/CDA1 family)
MSIGVVQPGGPVYNASNTPGKVALTFDDGPNGQYTDDILAALERNHVKATFFPIGENVANDPDKLRAIRDAGHAIGNHTWDHPQLTGLANDGVERELNSTSDAIEAATGERPTIFRAPYGDHNARVDDVARQNGLRDILWDVDTEDWSRPGSEAIRSAAVNDAHDGSIILMHDGGGNRAQTAAALDDIIAGLRAKGLEPVTVPELLDGQ